MGTDQITGGARGRRFAVAAVGGLVVAACSGPAPSVPPAGDAGVDRADTGPVAGDAGTPPRPDAGVQFPDDGGLGDAGDAGSAPTDAGSTGPVLSVTSPDGRLQLRFELRDGVPGYAVSRDGRPVLGWSRLGLRFAERPSFVHGIEVAGSTVRNRDDTWHPIWDQVAEIRDHHNELTLHLRQPGAPDRSFDVVARMFDDGLGLRYVVGAQAGLGPLAITDEDTELRFATGGTAWWIPADFDDDESLYRRGPLSAVTGANTPVTIRLDGGPFISVHEADLEDYGGMALRMIPGAPGAFRVALAPARSDRTRVKVLTEPPFETPWRVLLVSDDAAGLVESTVVLNLNDPCAICGGDVSWIQPSKYVGIWWEIHKGISVWAPGNHVGAATDNAKRYIDFAAAHGIPYFLAEGWNEGWSGGPVSFTRAQPHFDLEEVVSYGQARGVGFIAHMETDADVGALERQIDGAFDRYEQLGIHAIKTGYVGEIDGYHHASQRMVNHYAEVLEKAADHQLMVDVHEPIKPTGLRRKYPNLMSGEGARGMEWNAWSRGNPPSHTLALPFTRVLAGPLDYTPGIFDLRWAPDRLPESVFAGAPQGRVHSTRARQLALYVLLFSGVQMVTDLPQHYEGVPEFRFIEDVPVAWDDTRVQRAAIGEYLSVARRSGTDWYLGSGTDHTPRALAVPLGFLAPGDHVAEIYGDAPDADLATNPEAVEMVERLVSPTDVLVVSMVSGGGQAVRFRPATAADRGAVDAYAEPALEVTAVTVPPTAVADDVVTVQVRVENRGNIVGGRDVFLTAGSATVASAHVRVGAGSHRDVAMQLRVPAAPGAVQLRAGGMPGVLTVAASSVPAPANVRVASIAQDAITLAWDPAAGATGYRVYRHTPGGGFTDALAELGAGDTTHADAGVDVPETYTYAVRAMHTGGALSAMSNEVSTRAMVAVELRALVPTTTPLSDTVYVTGNIEAIGAWRPAGLPMAYQGNGIWTVTVDVPHGTRIEYKYTRGTWERVESWGALVGQANRGAIIDSLDGAMQIADTTPGAGGAIEGNSVRYWRDPLVASTTPADRSVGAAPASIVVAFARGVEPAGDLADVLRVTQYGQPVAGVVTQPSGAEVNWIPSAALSPGSYRATVSDVSSALGADSVDIQRPFEWSFTVE